MGQDRMPPTASALQERVLVLALMSRDGELAQEALTRAGIAAEVVRGVESLCEAIADGTGAVLVTEESLTAAATQLLLKTLEREPPWSDLPIVVRTTMGRSDHGGSRSKVLRRSWVAAAVSDSSVTRTAPAPSAMASQSDSTPRTTSAAMPARVSASCATSPSRLMRASTSTRSCRAVAVGGNLSDPMTLRSSPSVKHPGGLRNQPGGHISLARGGAGEGAKESVS